MEDIPLNIFSACTTKQDRKPLQLEEAGLGSSVFDFENSEINVEVASKNLSFTESVRTLVVFVLLREIKRCQFPRSRLFGVPND